MPTVWCRHCLKRCARVCCPDLAEASLGGQLADFKKELLAEVKDTLSTMLAQKEQRPQSFSSVNQSAAESVLQELHIREVDGNQLDPIPVSGGVECTSFDLSLYSDENAGTPHLMRHHEEQLGRCGVLFGPGGYAMYDVRQERSCLQFKSASQTYRGTTDCTLAPYGLLGPSRATCMRVGFEHKQSRKQAADTVRRCMRGGSVP